MIEAALTAVALMLVGIALYSELAGKGYKYAALIITASAVIIITTIVCNIFQ